MGECGLLWVICCGRLRACVGYHVCFWAALGKYGLVWVTRLLQAVVGDICGRNIGYCGGLLWESEGY